MRAGDARLVLITGGAGFVGASLVRALEARGERVRVVDWGSSAGFRYLDGTAAELIEGDLLDPSVVSRAVQGVDAVFHLAARTSVPASMKAPLEDLEQNVLGTVRLLDAVRGAGASRFVFASSNAAVGLMEPPAREDAFPRPVAPYGAAKLAAEGYLHAYWQSYGLVTVGLRFSNAYGPYALHKISVVAAFLKAYLAGKPITIYGDGSQTRDFVHVDDLVDLLLRALDAPAEQVAGELFQAGTGRETTVLELAETLLRVGGREGRIEHLPPRHGDVARNFSDVGKARERLGYEPRVELDEGLRRTVEWFDGALADPRFADLREARVTSGSD
ncbi:MAG: NAD-dependent epimerase/dehydratase family protein [Chloroflexi bacterium]|nr:NAD-dependent epimerase/dehydratase family protein [Chloroflexota bacterium]